MEVEVVDVCSVRERRTHGILFGKPARSVSALRIDIGVMISYIKRCRYSDA